MSCSSFLVRMSTEIIGIQENKMEYEKLSKLMSSCLVRYRDRRNIVRIGVRDRGHRRFLQTMLPKPVLRRPSRQSPSAQ